MASYRPLLLALTTGALALGLAVAGAPAGAASSAWTRYPTADPALGGGYALSDVACGAATDCTSVGYAWAAPATETGPAVPLAEHWNGTSWSIEATPVPAGAADSQLSSLWCAGGVSQPCLAVGYTSAGSQYDSPRAPLAMAWDGSSWTLRSVPMPAGAASAELNGISCAGPNACKAVGAYSRTALFYPIPFIATWNGAAWSFDRFSVPAAAVRGSFQAVSCFSAISCSAVGSWESSTGKVSALADTWNGTSWHLDSPANPGPQTLLLGADCMARTTCTAVGTHSTVNNTEIGLVERRAGGFWSAQTPPSVIGADVSQLTDIDCLSASFCEAVGASSGHTVNSQGYGEIWNGHYWKIEYLPVGGYSNALSGVSCAGSQFCMAVGRGSEYNAPVVGESFVRTG